MSLSVVIFSISRRHAYGAAATYSHREYSTSVKVIDKPTLTSLKRGTGGRSSFSGTVATVFGATGFVGRHLVNELGKSGAQVIIPYRSEPDDLDVKQLKLCGDLGQILFQPFDLRDPVSIRKCIKYSNVVFNLIGSYVESKNFKYDDVHVKGARQIAIACRELNIPRLMHISSLNVTEHPKSYILPKPLDFLSSKLRGEHAVMEEFPDATIFRPSVIYGNYDNFIFSLCHRYRRTRQSIPLYASGKKTVKQPVFVKDVVDGIMSALKNDESKGKIYQVVGPERYLLCEIANYCGRIRYRSEAKRYHNALFDPYLHFKIILSHYILARFWFKPRWGLCYENLELESVTDEVDYTLPTLEDLGVKPTLFESQAEHIIRKKYLVRTPHFELHLPYDPIVPPQPHRDFF